MTAAACPCGSGKTYADCCARAHQGHAPHTAEALMRARYSAYCLGLDEFLRRSWHPDTRPAQLATEQPAPWQRLQVNGADEDGNRATVSFEATWRSGDEWGLLRETSLFLREEGNWYYHSGDTTEQRLKPERNHPCPCGSGRKFKKCCSV